MKKFHTNTMFPFLQFGYQGALVKHFCPYAAGKSSNNLIQVAPICQRGGLSAGTTSASTTTTEATTKRPECPNGWETLTGDGSSIKCFKYWPNEVHATLAEDTCRAQGGHLASVHSIEEQSFLVQTFNPSDDCVWIGAVDPDHNRVWEWTDGSSFDFSYWRSGQPNGRVYYTVMDFGRSSDGGWSDFYEDNNCGYICQLSF